MVQSKPLILAQFKPSVTELFDPEYMPGKSGSVEVASGKLTLFRQESQVRNGTAIETA